MNAKKCDRCGAFYEQKATDGMYKYKVIKDGYPYSAVIDLCPNCTDELEKWVVEKEKDND